MKLMALNSFLFVSLAVGQAQGPTAQVPLQVDEVPVHRGGPLTLDAIPLIGFGTWNLHGENATEAVSWAIQTGYRHIDCADAYGNEVEVGLGIYDGLQKTGLSRDDLWITSKLWNSHHSFDEVELALNMTLAHLGLEYLNLYHMHWPVAEKNSGKHKISYLETWAAMEFLQQTGKTRHIGVSNFSPYQLSDLLENSNIRPAVHQMEMHPYLQQNDWRAQHEELGIHVTAYSPLGGTNPTYDPGEPPSLLTENKVVHKIAKKRDCTTAQVVLAWGLTRGTSVIPKSAHKERITENFKTLECVLTKKDLNKIDELGSYHHRYGNPSKKWGVDLFDGLEDSKGKHKKHS